MRKVLVTVLICVLIFGLFVAGFAYAYRARKPVTAIMLYGNVDVRQVDIGFRVAGQVTDLLFEEGDIVKKGDLMTVLDKTPYDNKVNEAKANVEAVAINLENAERHFKRREELIGIGGVSQEDFDNALTTRDQLRANLALSMAALAVAMDNYEYTEVYAPTDGVILSRIREPGTVVNPAEPVYTLSVTSPVWIRAYVDEPHLGEVYYGMPAEIYTDIEGGEVYMGKVGFISPVSEFTPKTVQSTELRTDLVYRLRIYADNPDRGLVQGMPVTVKLKLKKMNRRGSD